MSLISDVKKLGNTTFLFRDRGSYRRNVIMSSQIPADTLTPTVGGNTMSMSQSHLRDAQLNASATPLRKSTRNMTRHLSPVGPALSQRSSHGLSPTNSYQMRDFKIKTISNALKARLDSYSEAIFVNDDPQQRAAEEYKTMCSETSFDLRKEYRYHLELMSKLSLFSGL